MRRLLVLMLALVPLVGLGWTAAWAAPAGTDYSVTVSVGGVDRHYTLFAPSTVASDPGLVVALHGVSGTGSGFEATTGLDVFAAAAGDYVAYPDGIGKSWNAGACCAPADASGVDDLGFLDALISGVQSAYGLDPTKLALAGFSNGGMMAFRYACSGRLPVRYVVADASLPLSGSCPSPPPLHVLSVNGLADNTILWSSANNSALFTAPQPAASAAIVSLARSDGCGTGVTRSTDPATGTVHAVASQCPVGTSFDQYVSPKLDHRWPAGPTAIPNYGVNTTSLLANWLSAAWAG